MWNDLSGRAVLVTGGTRGIGLATGLAFDGLGADVTLTHKWGSVEDDVILAAFARAGAPAPSIVQADVSHEDDVRQVMDGIQARHERLEVFVVERGLRRHGDGRGRLHEEGPARRHRLLGLAAREPHVDGAHRVRPRTARTSWACRPKAPTACTSAMTSIGAAKSVLETLCRYLHYRLREEGSTVNVVRTRFVDTVSLADTLGEDFIAFRAALRARRAARRPKRSPTRSSASVRAPWTRSAARCWPWIAAPGSTRTSAASIKNATCIPFRRRRNHES